MQTKFIGTDTTYYFSTDEEHFNQWRTNSTGSCWDLLMGMSWEEMEPSEDLLKHFAAVTSSATNGD